MVQFIPKSIDENVNISKTSPVKEFITLFFGLIGIVFVFYFLLGFALTALIARMPVKFENTISHLYDLGRLGMTDEDDFRQLRAQGVLDRLAANLENNDKEYKVFIKEDDMANAFALPGGRIMILSGLLNEAESENELAMILAHELGHYHNNDHLKGLGRGIVVVFLSAVLFGNDSGVTGFVSGALTSLDMKFSRAQELQADEFALKLLNKTYGHVAGAVDFFVRTQKNEKMPKILRYFSTHPIDEIRIQQIERDIKQNSYRIGNKTPLLLNEKDG